MIFFITLLRALAACIITNAHYVGIYPTDLIANGGLLGDIIFFAVSGYCLYNIKKSFPRWYGKRFIRCYLPVFLITVAYLLIGAYNITETFSLIYWLVYPTHYHFVASILILYIPYYFVIKTNFLKNHLGLVMGVVALFYLVVYIFFYNKTYYHIDTVREPMIRFLFFEAMLLGAWFKQKDMVFRNKPAPLCLIGIVICAAVYFVSKMSFSKYQAISEFQIVNQLLIFAFLFFVFRFFSGYDSLFEKMPKAIKKVVTFLANITLEIYLVQYVLIDLFKNVAVFPINWFVTTASIIVTATALHFVANFLFLLPQKCKKAKNK